MVACEYETYEYELNENDVDAFFNALDGDEDFLNEIKQAVEDVSIFYIKLFKTCMY